MRPVRSLTIAGWPVALVNSPRKLIGSENPGNQMPADAAAVLPVLFVAPQHALFKQRADNQRRIANQEDGDVPWRWMGCDEGDVGDEIAGVDRVPHESIRSLDDDAAVR